MSTTLGVQGSPGPDWYDKATKRFSQFEALAREAFDQARSDWKALRTRHSNERAENDKSQRAA